MCKPRFYRCAHCGNILGIVNDGGVTPICCGEKMTLLNPNTTDGAHEKHVPIITVDGNLVTVDVGSVAHPMQVEHYIEWIFLETAEGNQRKCIKPGDEPKSTFALVPGDKAIAAYEYCNLHGLWKAMV
ncbi:desulfoferrodoxin family protein [Eubacterium aggregans]|uniref:desulfoferrodoxin family protein n=1 Tax=Eubacterium aggregans TaxID=81409 RepID=UPI003F31E6FA